MCEKRHLEKYVDKVLQMSNDINILVSCISDHLKVSLAEEEFNNKVE